MEQKIKVGIAGFTGYTGLELLRILSNHPYVKITSLSSSTHYGKHISEVFGFLPLDIKISKELEDVDVVFLALPHESSLEYVPYYVSKGIKVIDLSGAFRIKNRDVFKEYYNLEYQEKHLNLLSEVIYGLPELYKDKIKNAKIVSNPGCYPTAIILGAYPIIKAINYQDILYISAVSGVSGAGKKLREDLHYPYMEQNAFYYAIGKHRHVPEMIEHLGVEVQFSPMIIPASRGMIANIRFYNVKEEDFKSIYQSFYKDKPFVKILKEPPHMKWSIGTNMCYIYFYYHKNQKTLEVISSIDNLGKGASSQAIQNMNIMFNLDETIGLYTSPLIP